MPAELNEEHRALLRENPIWTSGTEFENVYLSVDERGAVLDRDGEFLIPPDYSSEISFGDGIISCRTYRPSGSYEPFTRRLFDAKTGEQTFEFDATDTETEITLVSPASGFVIVSFRSKVDDHERYVIDPRGRRLGLMGPDVTTCYSASIGGDFIGVDFGNSKELAVIDRQANEVQRIGPNFSEVLLSGTSHEPVARVTVEGERLQRLCDRGGQLSENAYPDIWRFSRSGHAIVRDRMRFGLIDTRGDLVLPMSSTKLRSTAGDCVVFGDAKKGVMTLAGEVLIEPQYKEIILPIHADPPQSFLAAKGKSWRLIDRQNKELLRNKDFPAKPCGGGPTLLGNWHVEFGTGVGMCFIDGSTFEIQSLQPKF